MIGTDDAQEEENVCLASGTCFDWIVRHPFSAFQRWLIPSSPPLHQHYPRQRAAADLAGLDAAGPVMRGTCVGKRSCHRPGLQAAVGRQLQEVSSDPAM